MSQVRLYIASHKNTPILKSDVFNPIHVGKACAKSEVKESLRGYIGDDTGQNISSSNPNFAELTALYWIWKNRPKDSEHLGLMHYSRYFDFSESKKNYPEDHFHNLNNEVKSNFGFDNLTVQNLCSKYDLIVPPKWEMRKEHITYEHERYGFESEERRSLINAAPDVLTMEQQYQLCHEKEDFDLALKIMKEKWPEIYDVACSSIKETKARFLNMAIMKAEVFDKYCNFIFSILFEMQIIGNYSEEKYQPGNFNSRVFGFLSERLSSIYFDFLIHNKCIEYKELDIAYANFIEEVNEVHEVNVVNEANESNLSISNVELNELENIALVFSCDDNYADYLGVVLQSIVEHNRGRHFDIYVLDGGISKSKINKLTKYASKIGFQLNFVTVDLNLFKEKCPLKEESKHITLPTYFRFSVSSLLPAHINKVMYLDCDVIVQSNLVEFWSVDLTNVIAAVVPDTYEVAEHQQHKLGMKSDELYFNAGIMLINLEKWREERIEEKLFENTDVIRDNIVFVDQDVLNFTLKGKVKYLGYEWNLQQTAFHFTRGDLKGSDLESAKSNPKIIHYSGHIKPWDNSFSSWHPLTSRFPNYFQNGPFKLRYFYWTFKQSCRSIFYRIFGRIYEYRHLSHEKLNGMFDSVYYLEKNPDVFEANIDPLLHYVMFGWKEGRDPNSNFSTKNYLKENPDVASKRMNPLYHYLVYGLAEQRRK